MDYLQKIEETAKDVFNVNYLRPAQEAVITKIVENAFLKQKSDSITVLPTGAGKSLCFTLPALLFPHLYTIITFPLLSLMSDQARRLDELGIEYALIRGGMTQEEKSLEISKLKSLKANILITNMESLIYMMENKRLDFMVGRIELFVIDEAHTAISWASTFRPALKEAAAICSYLSPHQRLCFSATCSNEVIFRLKNEVLTNADASVLRLSSDRENIFYMGLRSLSKRRDVEKFLTPSDRRPAIVFCSYRNETKEYSTYLENAFPALYYHAGLSKEEKKRTEDAFYKSDDAVLFSTNAYGMGVDKKNIRSVIHLHAPSDASSFLQEAGRGGRDGLFMLSLVLYDERDKGDLKGIFQGDQCIRSELLRLMGEESGRKCTSCSKCTLEPVKSAGEDEILHLIGSFPFLFTRKSAARILRIRRLRSWRESEIENAINTLIRERTIISLFGHLCILKREEKPFFFAPFLLSWRKRRR